MRNTYRDRLIGSMRDLLCLMLVFVIANMMAPVQADAATAEEIDRDVDSGLEKLYANFRIFLRQSYPAEYGNSDIITFIVKHDGVVHQKDFGKTSEKLEARSK